MLYFLGMWEVGVLLVSFTHNATHTAPIKGISGWCKNPTAVSSCSKRVLLLLRLHLRHVGGDKRTPVSTLYVELGESQTLHQFQEDPCSCQTVKSW